MKQMVKKKFSNNILYMDGRTNPSFRFKTFTTLARLLIKKFQQCDAFYSEVQFSKWMRCPKQ